MDKSKKQIAIERCAAFLSDRVTYAVETRDGTRTTEQAIKDLLEFEFRDVHEIEEDDGR